jgi:hypothetical protein
MTPVALQLTSEFRSIQHYMEWCFFFICFGVFIFFPELVFASGFSAEPLAAAEGDPSGPLPEGPLVAG